MVYHQDFSLQACLFSELLDHGWKRSDNSCYSVARSQLFTLCGPHNRNTLLCLRTELRSVTFCYRYWSRSIDLSFQVRSSMNSATGHSCRLTTDLHSIRRQTSFRRACSSPALDKPELSYFLLLVLRRPPTGTRRLLQYRNEKAALSLPSMPGLKPSTYSKVALSRCFFLETLSVLLTEHLVYVQAGPHLLKATVG